MQRRTVQIVLIAGSVMSVVGCAYSITGGLLGGLITAVVTGLLLIGGATTTSSCGDSVHTCLSMIPDTEEPDMGPCLSPPPPDAVESDIQPCLSQVPPDVVEPDVGPCLDQLPPDVMEPDIEPCLSQLPPDAETPEDSANASPSTSDAPALAKTDIQKRLIESGALPEDIAQKLNGGDTDATS